MVSETRNAGEGFEHLERLGMPVKMRDTCRGPGRLR